MTIIRFNDLTPELLEGLKASGELNGCGGKGKWLKPPKWLFTASCLHHDFQYTLGHTEKDRKKADLQFYKAMLVDASRASFWNRPWYKLMAWTYYKAVRWFAKDFFYYADAKRTLEDLQALTLTSEK